MNNQSNLAVDTRFKPFICATCKMEITEPTMHGWVYAGYDEINMRTRLEPCPTCSDPARSQRINSQIDRLLGQSRIPLRMAAWSFSTLPSNVDKVAKEKAVLFSNKQAPKEGLYLYGKNGAGKTGIAISIIQAAMRRGEDALFISSLDLLKKLREAIGRSMADHHSHDGEPRQDAILELVKSVQWLALDDLATENSTPYVIQEYKGIIESRMNTGKYTIFTCNLDLRDLGDYWRPKDLAPNAFFPAQRVIDRMAEYSTAVHMQGRNLRLVP